MPTCEECGRWVEPGFSCRCGGHGVLKAAYRIVHGPIPMSGRVVKFSYRLDNQPDGSDDREKYIDYDGAIHFLTGFMSVGGVTIKSIEILDGGEV